MDSRGRKGRGEHGNLNRSGADWRFRGRGNGREAKERVMDRNASRWMNGRKEGRKEGWMDGKRYGQTDGMKWGVEQ